MYRSDLPRAERAEFDFTPTELAQISAPSMAKELRTPSFKAEHFDKLFGPYITHKMGESTDEVTPSDFNLPIEGDFDTFFIGAGETGGKVWRFVQHTPEAASINVKRYYRFSQFLEELRMFNLLREDQDNGADLGFYIPRVIPLSETHGLLGIESLFGETVENIVKNQALREGNPDLVKNVICGYQQAFDRMVNHLNEAFSSLSTTHHWKESIERWQKTEIGNVELEIPKIWARGLMRPGEFAPTWFGNFNLYLKTDNIVVAVDNGQNLRFGLIDCV